MSEINLPNYFRTEGERYLQALVHEKDGTPNGARDCRKVLYPGKNEYCPDQGRDRPREEPSRFKHVSLLMDADPDEWRIRSVAVSRNKDSGQEYGGNRVHALVDGKIDGIGFTLPTQLFNIEIGPDPRPDVIEWMGRPVDPVIRMLEPNPGSIKYYGVVFAPYHFSRKPKPFTQELKDFGKPGIASLGLAVPKYRTVAKDLVGLFEEPVDRLVKGLKVESVSVPDYMETSATLAVQASYEALRVLPTDIRKTIGAVLIGTESPDHKVKGPGTIIQEMLGLPKMDNITLTSEFACVPAWMNLVNAYALIHAGWCDSVLIVGADVAAGAPGHALDLDTGAMGGAMVVSRYNHILTSLDSPSCSAVKAITSATSDESDFQNDHKYPDRNIGAYSLKPFEKLQTDAVIGTLGKLGMKPSDFKVVAPHTPNGNSPYKLMKALGFSDPELLYVLDMVKNLGNTYSAAVIGNLRRGVELMKPGDRALVSAYGSTAGAVAAGFQATELLPKFLEAVVPTTEILNYKVPVSYAQRLFRKDMVIMD